MTQGQPQKPTDERPSKKPYSAGVLLLMAIVALALAVFCFNDVVYPANALKKWQEEGATFTIYLNWVVLFGAAGGAVYWLVLAIKRWNTPPGAPDAPKARESSGPDEPAGDASAGPDQDETP